MLSAGFWKANNDVSVSYSLFLQHAHYQQELDPTADEGWILANRGNDRVSWELSLAKEQLSAEDTPEALN